MVMKDIDKNQSKLEIITHDFNVPKDHISRFVVEFIEECYPKLDIEVNEKKNCRPSYNLCSMLKLIVYAKLEHIESARIIADMAKYHDIYKFVCDGITPSERTIQRYRNDYGEYYEQLLKMTLETAKKEEYTEFNHVAIDGTVKKAFNSKPKYDNKKRMQIINQILQRTICQT